jgi:single-strand DNA-binding protein
MLRVEIIGNLGSDPEQRFTSEGVAMTTISVAVNSRRRGPDGEYVDRTDWFRARTMGAKAEYVQRFVKGQRVLVIGRLEIGEYTAKITGERKTSYDIWADDVVNLSPREDGGTGRPVGQTSAPVRSPGDHPASSRDDVTDLEDLPF